MQPKRFDEVINAVERHCFWDVWLSTIYNDVDVAMVVVVDDQLANGVPALWSWVMHELSKKGGVVVKVCTVA